MVLILNIKIQNLYPINSKFIPSLKSLESESLSTIVASSNSISILTFLPEISSTKRIFFWGDFGAAGVCSSSYQNKEQIWLAISSIFFRKMVMKKNPSCNYLLITRSTVIFFKKNLKHEGEFVGCFWFQFGVFWCISWEGHSLPLRMPLFCQYYTSWFTNLCLIPPYFGWFRVIYPKIGLFG